MQNPTQSPEPEQQVKCPRCESTNTKFSYYNNYNLSQPRHYCKNCRRYWTKGGALRNIPIGGGIRKNSRRSSSSSSSSSSSCSSNSTNRKHQTPNSASETNSHKKTGSLELSEAETISSLYPCVDLGDRLLDLTGSFSSLLGFGESGSFGDLCDSGRFGGLQAYANSCEWNGEDNPIPELESCWIARPFDEN